MNAQVFRPAQLSLDNTPAGGDVVSMAQAHCVKQYSQSMYGVHH